MFRVSRRTRRDDRALLVACQTALRTSGLSSQALAQQASISPEKAEKFLSSSSWPGVGTITAVARCIGVDPAAFVRPSGNFHVHFSFHGEQRVPATSDKRTSMEFGRNIEQLVNARLSRCELPATVSCWLEGLDPSDAKRLLEIGLVSDSALVALQSIDEHVTAWIAALRTKNRSKLHIYASERYVRLILQTAGVTHWTQITATRIEDAINRVKLKGDRAMTAESRYKFVGGIKSFARFMKRSGRAQTNPLADLEKSAVCKRSRRPLSRAELDWLVQTTQTSPTQRMRDWNKDWEATGPERALIYTLVRWSGLRAKEVRGLRVRDFWLDVATPHVFVSAMLAKNHTENRIPLPAALAGSLREYLRLKAPDTLALPMPNKAALMLRLDMATARTTFINAASTPVEREKRARSPFLEVNVETDRYMPFDFHSLRGTASVLLQEAGVPLGFVKCILNHKTLAMTLGNYTNPGLDTLSRSMEGSRSRSSTDVGTWDSAIRIGPAA